MNFGGPGFTSGDTAVETMLNFLDLAVKILVFGVWRLPESFASVLIETGVGRSIAPTPVEMLRVLLKS